MQEILSSIALGFKIRAYEMREAEAGSACSRAPLPLPVHQSVSSWFSQTQREGCGLGWRDSQLHLRLVKSISDVHG